MLSRRLILKLLGGSLLGLPMLASAAEPVHIVMRGDSLSAIAKRYGVSVASIRSANGLRTDVIYAGMKLRIPGGKPMTPPAAVAIIARKAWALKPILANSSPMGRVTRLTVHHTAEKEACDKYTDLQFLRIIESSHQQRGMACVAYHYLVGRDGKVYEGRPVALQGSHTRGANENNIGICLIGDFEVMHPTGAQLQSLEKLLGLLRHRHRIAAKSVFGHRDLGQSICPGRNLYAWVKTYRARA